MSTKNLTYGGGIEHMSRDGLPFLETHWQIGGLPPSWWSQSHRVDPSSGDSGFQRVDQYLKRIQ